MNISSLKVLHGFFYKPFVFQKHEIMEIQKIYIIINRLNIEQNICDREFFLGIFQQAYVILLSYRFEM